MQVRLVAIVPVLGLLLGGCTSRTQAAPKPLPTLEATVSPTPVALEVPESAKPATTVGAAAFARFYLQVLSEALNSGEFASVRAISAPECGFCNDLEAATRRDVAAGRRFSGGKYEVLSAEATQNAPGDAVVDVLYARTASTTTGKDGTALSRGRAEPRSFMQIRVLRVGASWVTRAVRFPVVPQ